MKTYMFIMFVFLTSCSVKNMREIKNYEVECLGITSDDKVEKRAAINSCNNENALVAIAKFDKELDIRVLALRSVFNVDRIKELYLYYRDKDRSLEKPKREALKKYLSEKYRIMYTCIDIGNADRSISRDAIKSCKTNDALMLSGKYLRDKSLRLLATYMVDNMKDLDDMLTFVRTDEKLTSEEKTIFEKKINEKKLILSPKVEDKVEEPQPKKETTLKERKIRSKKVNQDQSKPIDAEFIDILNRRAQADAKVCYEQFSKRFSLGPGKLRIQAKVGNLGKISSVKFLENTFNHENFTKCVEDRYLRIEYLEDLVGKTFEFSIVFQ
jgi:hypothetical protein